MSLIASLIRFRLMEPRNVPTREGFIGLLCGLNSARVYREAR